MAADFSGQDLRGRSFKGQDLSGANFNSADIRGVDLSEANLTGAQFRNAHAGLTHRRKILLLAIAAILALLSGCLSFLLSLCIATLISPETVAVTHGIPNLGLVALLIFAVLLSVRQGFEALNKWVIPILVLLVVLVTFILGGYRVWGVAIDVAALAFATAVALSQSVAVIVAAAEQVWDAVAGCGVGAIAAATACFMAARLGILPWIPLGTVALGIWGAWRIDAAAAQYQGIATGAIALSSTGLAAWGGTRFRGANLSQADFTQARLKNSDFREANLTQTRFLDAAFLAQSRLGHSILQQGAVRSLLTTGNGRGQSYREANLQGANLRGADLSGAILSDANLSGATCHSANLDGANLTRVNAVGCDFRQARMTAACVDQWDIDRTTLLDGVDCRFVYLATDAAGQKMRLPATENWNVGEFSQQFAVTDQDATSIFELGGMAPSAINAEEILASLMVLVRMAIADNALEVPERELVQEAIKALDLPSEMTLERLIDERMSLDTLLKKINSPLVKDKVYQSAYLMARIDGELELEEENFLTRIQTSLNLSSGAIDKARAMIQETQNLSILEQVQAITDPEKRERAVNTNIRLMSIMHAVNGAMPIPGFAIVTHLMIYKDQVELVQKIGRIWGYPADYKSPQLEQALFGTLGATAARVAVSNVALLVPVWGSVVGASTAFSMTWAIGELTNQFFASGGQLDELTLKSRFAEAKALGKTLFQELQGAIARQQAAIGGQVSRLQQQLQRGEISQADYLRQMRGLGEQEADL
jgi:uncharacterized protein YjbI with pentapeptide repeats/uncharacterized protein (DUF697 family)